MSIQADWLHSYEFSKSSKMRVVFFHFQLTRMNEEHALNGAEICMRIICLRMM